jgi:hypothetical protein
MLTVVIMWWGIYSGSASYADAIHLDTSREPEEVDVWRKPTAMISARKYDEWGARQHGMMFGAARFVSRSPLTIPKDNSKPRGFRRLQ